jgi:hypothetical protein
MDLEEKILNDYRHSLKTGDNARASILSFLRSGLKNYAIGKSKEKLEDADVISVIRKYIKRNQDSIAQFKAAGREDLANKEFNELKILESYLPPQLSDRELNRIVEQAVSKVAATSMKEMGKVMKEVMKKVGGQADAKQVSDLVKKALSGQKQS